MTINSPRHLYKGLIRRANSTRSLWKYLRLIYLADRYAHHDYR